MNGSSTSMARLSKALRQCALLPPLVFVTAICVWMTSTMFPYSIVHVCVSGLRYQFDCFPDESFAFTDMRDQYDGSTRITNVQVTHNSLMLDGVEGSWTPIKPVKEVEKLQQRGRLAWFAEPAIESEAVVEHEDFHQRLLDTEDRNGRNDPAANEFQNALVLDVHQEDVLQHINNETELHSTEDDDEKNSQDRSGEEGKDLPTMATSLTTSQPGDESEPQATQTDKNMPGDAQEDDTAYQLNITSSIAPNKNPNVQDIFTVVAPAADLAESTSSYSRADEIRDQTQGRDVKLTDQDTMSGNKSIAWSIPLHDKKEIELVQLMETMRRTAAPPNGFGKGGASWILRKRDNSVCDGRKVYIYDLPSKFNTDLQAGCRDILPWFNMCKFMINSGMGEQIRGQNDTTEEENVLVPAGRWYGTNQYALEMVFHARMQEHKCRTLDPEEANAFYVPFYGGLDVLRWHFRKNTTNERRDKLSLELVRWLEEQKWWRRRGGSDHILVLGKISWDFRRSGTGTWGSRLLRMPETQNVTNFLIERHPWATNDIGIPHPTFFHPSHDDDIRLWQQKIDGTRRTHLVSFAGMPRPHQSGNIRSVLIQQCENRSSCFFLHCSGTVCQHPENLISLFTQSEFCLQPPGDSPTRRSIFDSLVAGCMPVLFNLFSAYFQYPWHLPADPARYSVFVRDQDVIRDPNPVNVVDLLQRIPPAVRAEMRRTIIYDVVPGLLYAAPGSNLREFNDAFDIALDRVLWRITNYLQTSTAYS